MHRRVAGHLACDQEVAFGVAGQWVGGVAGQRFAFDERLPAILQGFGVGAPVFMPVGVGAVADQDPAVDVGGNGIAVCGEPVLRKASQLVDTDHRIAQVGGAARGGQLLQLGIGHAGGTDQRGARALMVGGDDDQGVAALGRKVAGHGDGAVELQRVEQPALGVHRVGLLVDRRAFDHQHKALWRLCQHGQSFARHLVEHRLVGEAVVVHHSGAGLA